MADLFFRYDRKANELQASLHEFKGQVKGPTLPVDQADGVTYFFDTDEKLCGIAFTNFARRISSAPSP